MQHRYAINLFWSDEDDCWIANVPDLDPCSAHGDTPVQAATEIEIAIGAVLEARKEHGYAIPEPKYDPNPFKEKSKSKKNGKKEKEGVYNTALIVKKHAPPHPGEILLRRPQHRPVAPLGAGLHGREVLGHGPHPRRLGFLTQRQDLPEHLRVRRLLLTKLAAQKASGRLHRTFQLDPAASKLGRIELQLGAERFLLFKVHRAPRRLERLLQLAVQHLFPIRFHEVVLHADAEHGLDHLGISDRSVDNHRDLLE